MDYLIFSILGDRYAIPVTQVRQILDGEFSADAETLPPPFVGSVVHRDVSAPVYDLRMRLDYPEADAPAAGAIIVADTGSAGRCRVIGFLVDEVFEVLHVELRSLSDLPVLERGGPQSPCRRVIEDGDALIIVLDATSLVGEEERKALAAMEMERETNARSGNGE